MLQTSLLLLALIPFSLSLIANMSAPQARDVSIKPERAALVFDQYLVNMGPVRPQRFVKAYFRFHNTSSHNVHVTDLVPSCGCLNPHLEKRDYAPGETGEFFIRIDTSLQKPGPQEYTVNLQYEDTRARETELTFKVSLPQRQVIVRPKALVFYQSGIVSDPQKVSVIDFRQKALGITAVRSNSKRVEVTLREQTKDQEGNRVIPIDVRIKGAIPPGQHKALITITTNDPDYQQLQVPLLLQSLDKQQD